MTASAMNEITAHDEAGLLEGLHQARKGSFRRLGEMLTGRGFISEQELEQALQQLREQPHLHLGELLLNQGRLSRDQLNQVLAEQLGIPRIALEGFELKPNVAALIPDELALRYNVLPLASLPEALFVAVSDPFDDKALAALRFETGRHIEPVLASSTEIGQALHRYYTGEAVVKALVEVAEPEPRQKTYSREIELEAKRKPVVRLVSSLILQAVHRGASDVHIRPGRDAVGIYFRVDGKLSLTRSLDKELLRGVIARIKILARMDVAEHRLPQDGHARVKAAGKEVDLRVSMMPTVNGESAVVRLLDKEKGVKDLDLLGFGANDLQTLKAMITRPQGMILVTGPTGSGKSTTLYAMLQHIRTRDPHIITIEDPVEYDMTGVEQVQISSAIGYTFSEALRHILRHDPDVIMVGEIRDLETARIANKAALTGHLVLSTLHTNDAASAVTRLIDMGVEPYLLSSTLIGSIAQRLVPLTCPHCKIDETVEPYVRAAMGVSAAERFQVGAGCAQCNYSGILGRKVVYELIPIKEELAAMIARGDNAAAIKTAALEQGMTPLTQQALTLARAGEISLAEAYAVRLE